MAYKVTPALPKDADTVVNISAETAAATGLLAEARNYELLRESEGHIKKAKEKSSELLLDGIAAWQAEYPDRAFDLLGSEDAKGRLLRLRVGQTDPRESLDPTVLSRRLLELGVSVEVVEDAFAAATKRGEPGKRYVGVRRVKGVG